MNRAKVVIVEDKEQVHHIIVLENGELGEETAQFNNKADAVNYCDDNGLEVV